MRLGILPLLLMSLVFLGSCFGVDRRGGITKYKDGLAETGKGRFRAAELPPPWKSPKRQLKQLVYENDAIDATIVVDALCGPKYDDAPLDRLAKELFQRLQSSYILSEKTFTMDGRTALRVDGGGAVDGVALKMAVVVMKKDFCLYDFSYFAPPARFSKGIRDFEGYLNGFETD